MTKKVQAIVIKSNDRKEKDKNILLFSLDEGKIWATLKGVKSQNAKLKIAQNLFCFGEFVLEEGKSGYVVTGVDILESFYEIVGDVDKYFEASSILEIVNNIDFSTKTEIANIFVLLLRSLKSLCFGNFEHLYVLNKFLIELFKEYGIGLYSEKCSNCGTKSFERIFLDYSTGQLECVACKGFVNEELDKSTFLALKLFNNNDFEHLKTIKLANGSAISLLKILVKNFELRFDKKLKLIGVLS